MTLSFNSDIFREYDIRGIADRDLTSGVVEMLGESFAEYLRRRGVKEHSVTVGYDARLSSPRLRDSLCKGLLSAGSKVIDIGLCPTPALYFSLYHLAPGAGVMITGSHNPAEFNGFKLCVGKDTIFGEEIQKIRAIMEQQSSPNPRSGTEAGLKATVHAIIPDYIQQLTTRFPRQQDTVLKVVLDAGNGTAGLAAPEVIRAMGCEVIDLFSEPDGRFPNHHPDPTIPKNLAALISTVKDTKADLGIAFDGDADRIGVVDERGGILWGDQLMIIFSRDILQERPGARFVSEVKCSQTLYNDIRARGGDAVMWKAGHSLIKAKMKETGAVLAGEMSGHLFFADRYFGYDDAIYAACRIVEITKKIKLRSGTLSSILADVPRTVNTPEIRFDCPDAIKFRVVDRIRDRFSSGDLQMTPKEIITIDGVRAVFEKGWGLLRASNTQPVLVMRFEAGDLASLDAIRQMMENEVSKVMAGFGA